MRIPGIRALLQRIISLLNTVLNVDTLAIETSVSREIDTSTDSAPITLVQPSSGKKLEARGAYIFTTSNSGEVWLEFPQTNQIIAKLYASKFKYAEMPKAKFTGATDEVIRVNWSGLDTDAKIFVVVVYREV